jgi:hypothetical protein
MRAMGGYVTGVSLHWTVQCVDFPVRLDSNSQAIVQKGPYLVLIWSVLPSTY